MSSPAPESPDHSVSHTEALFRVLSQARNDSKRRKTYNNSNPMEPYIKAARWFPLAIDPFVDLRSVLFDGMSAEFAIKAREVAGGNESEPIGPKDPEERARHDYHLQLYNEFTSLIPGFSRIVSKFEDNPECMNQFVNQLAEHANQARSDDIHSLRTRGILYILPGNFELATGFTPPLSCTGSKLGRGFKHPQTARMLCPRNALEEFDAAPDLFMDAVNDGTVHVRSSEMPAFLYDAEEEFDPDARETGLLRSETLLRVYRHIFTGPSTAATGESSKATKACKAKIHHLTKPTPKTIAYAAAMARFMMSSVETWNKRDGKFNLERFWHNIVQLFECAEQYGVERWANETLNWFNRQIPGLSNSRARDDDESGSEGGNDDMAAIFRAAARRRLEAYSEDDMQTRDNAPDREDVESPQRNDQTPMDAEEVPDAPPSPSPPRHQLRQRTPAISGATKSTAPRSTATARSKSTAKSAKSTTPKSTTASARSNSTATRKSQFTAPRPIASMAR